MIGTHDTPVPGGSLAVRLADVPDADPYADFLARCFEVEYAPLHDAATTAGILRWVRGEGAQTILSTAEPDVHAILATEGDTTLGTTVFAERGGVVHVWGLYVEPTRLRRGIGARLVRRICEETSPGGTLEVTVLEASTGAVGFYEALGFVTRNTRREEVFPGVLSAVRILDCRTATCAERLDARSGR